MVKKLLSFNLIAVLVIFLLPTSALSAGADYASDYRRFQSRWEAYTDDIWERSFDDPDIGADVFPKQEADVYGHSSEGGVIYKYLNSDGSALRYRLDLYGEGGNTRFDYYIVNNIIFVSVLRAYYSAMSYFPGSEILNYEFDRYVQSSGKWYQMDDIHKQALPISMPDIYTVRELDAMLAGDDPTDNTLDIPIFPYYGRRVALIKEMDTRSGPNTNYSFGGRFPQSTEITVFYQAKGGGVMWGMVEFVYNGKWYWLYTPMNRIDASNVNVPTDSEKYIYTRLSSTVTPRYGPGTKYAALSYIIPEGGIVKTYYQENDYAMVEYKNDDENQMRRGWVPIFNLSRYE